MSDERDEELTADRSLLVLDPPPQAAWQSGRVWWGQPRPGTHPNCSVQQKLSGSEDEKDEERREEDREEVTLETCDLELETWLLEL